MPSTKGRILIVDDDPHAVDILTRMLTREGYLCFGVRNGNAALEKARKDKIDVILLDVMMPGMDGLEVCRQLRADESLRQIPVILLTAKDDIETRSQGMALGVSEYLTKPVSKQELCARIESQLHAQEVTRKLSATEEAVSADSKPER